MPMEPDLSFQPLGNWSDEERIHAVKRIFSSITPHYDLLNHIMSGRRDVYWRRFSVSRIHKDAQNILDVATGTGDLAIDIALSLPHCQVVGLDFVPVMMDTAISKTAKKGLSARISYVAGDATFLPFFDNRFDAATIAFGLRNIPNREKALREMMRVVRPGGQVIVLEMTFPKNLRLRRFFSWYLNTAIPMLGYVISGDARAYQYLPDSIQDFLRPDQLTYLLESVGITSIKTFPLTFGLTYVHEGLIQ